MTLPKKSPFFSMSGVLFFLFVHACPIAFSYDSPDFDFKIVDIDAILLPQNDKDIVVEALNAVAGNFPDSDLIDDDLKEKALSVALALDPLNVNSRNAHFALLAGRTPAKTAFFQSSVSEVAERLWASAEKMSGRNGEPETRKLAKYIEEISLILHPAPTLNRIKTFARKPGNEERMWDRFLTLQPESNPSSSKITALLEDAKSNRPPKIAATKPKPAKPAKTPPAKLPPTPKSNGAELKLTTVEIPFVARTTATTRKSNLGGIASIEIAKARKADAGFFGITTQVTADMAYQMRLLSDPDGFGAGGLDLAEKLIRKDFPVWPERMLAEIRFDSDLPTRSSRRLTSADTSVAVSLLLDAVFTGRAPVPGLVFSGFISELSTDGVPAFTLGDEIAQVLDQAKAMEAGFLIVPESQYQMYVKGAIETRQLEYLFDPQLISYSSWDQLKATAFGDDIAKRSNAAAEFQKIQAVQDQMSLVALAKNDKVRERLARIVENYPQHLSARVMLAFGKAPDDPKAITSETIRGVDSALEPFLIQLAQAVEGDSLDDLDFSGIDSTLDESNKKLAVLLNGVVPDVRNYGYKAKELLNALKTLVGSGSKDSATTLQRFETIKKIFSELQLERTALGLDRITVGGRGLLR